MCATTDEITVASGTEVYYCYEVTNTGDLTLEVHDLDDSELGTILSGFSFTLTPGSSVNTVDAGLTVSAVITSMTVNTATWTASVIGGPSAQSTDSATVNIADPDITVNPMSLYSQQLENTIVVDQLDIGNVGAGVLNWTIAEDNLDLLNLNVPPMQGTAGEGEALHARDVANPDDKRPEWSNTTTPATWDAPQIVLYDNGP